MINIDYSIYYKNWHDESESHAEVMAQRLMKSLTPYVPTDRKAKVLDIGCGFGFAMRAMRNLGFNNLSGIEISEQQAKAARNAGLTVKVVEDTVVYLRGLKEHFDFVILFDVLEHIKVEQQIELLAAIHSIMSDGGRMVVTTPNANSILSARWRYNDYTHFSSFTEHSLSFVLKNAGFQKVFISNEKGLGKLPKNIFRKGYLQKLRKKLVRYFWLQVYKAELPFENIDNISFELNLFAVAEK